MEMTSDRNKGHKAVGRVISGAGMSAQVEGEERILRNPEKNRGISNKYGKRLINEKTARR